MILGQWKILNRSNMKLNYVQNILQTGKNSHTLKFFFFLTKVEQKEEEFGKSSACQKNEPEFLILSWLTLTWNKGLDVR